MKYNIKIKPLELIKLIKMAFLYTILELTLGSAQNLWQTTNSKLQNSLQKLLHEWPMQVKQLL